MKKLFIITTLLFSCLCVGCSDSTGGGNTGGNDDNNQDTTPQPPVTTPDTDEEKGEYEQGLTVLDDDLGSEESGHGSFDASNATNNLVKFQFYLPDTGKNNAYVSADFTDWNTDGSSNYLLEVLPSNKSANVFSNLYEVELSVPDSDIQLRVYLNDTDEANFTLETFDFSQSELTEGAVLVSESYSFENTVNYKYDGVLTVGPYKLYDSEGVIIPDSDIVDYTYSGRYVENNFDSWSLAVHYAATNSTSKNIITVKDANDMIIFQRMSKTYSHVFDGNYYVGYDLTANCNSWVFDSTKGYVIDGQGSAYINTGKIDYNNSGYDSISSHREMESGGYNYMFTNNGYTQQENQEGFTYMAMDINFSETIYKPTDDLGDVWNAYLFINPAVSMVVNGTTTTIHADLGLIGGLNAATNQIEWKLVRNSTHPEADPKFKVWHDGIVTTMPYDASIDAYTGADDLRFVCSVSENGFLLTITNLSTGVDHVINEAYNDFDINATYGRMLLGISYCPVRANVWNNRHGGELSNVIVTNSVVATYEPSGDYSNSDLRPFHPGSEVMFNGFVQAPDVAGYQMGYYKQAGTIGVGSNVINYNEGDLYTIYNIDYNGI